MNGFEASKLRSFEAPETADPPIAPIHFGYLDGRLVGKFNANAKFQGLGRAEVSEGSDQTEMAF